MGGWKQAISFIIELFNIADSRGLNFHGMNALLTPQLTQNEVNLWVEQGCPWHNTRQGEAFVLCALALGNSSTGEAAGSQFPF